VRNGKEWRSLLLMCVQTYYQIVCGADDRPLQNRAWRELIAAARAWSPLLACGGLIPRSIVDPLLRCAYRIKTRNQPRSRRG
jgi:hypothetical protein